MTELNCCYVLYLQHLRKRNRSQKIETTEYVVRKYIQELILSIYSLYKFSGIDPKITIFISKKSAALFDPFCDELISKNIIHEKTLIGFSPVPWGTKTLAWCAALSEFERFLFLDADIKFVRSLPIDKFCNRSMLFCSGNRKHVAKTRRFVNDYLGIKINKGVGLPITWFNRNGSPQVNYSKLRKKLERTLKLVERYVRKHGSKKGIDDQMIMSAVLYMMGIRAEDVTSDSRIFSATRNIYYKHNHHLITKHCNVNDAIHWLCDKGINASRYLVKDENFYYMVKK